MSTLVFTLVFLSGVSDLRHHFEKGLMPHPEKAFVWSYSLILEIGYTPIWFKTFWGGKKYFEKLIRKQKINVNQVESKSLCPKIIMGVVIYTEMKLLLEQIYSDIVVKGWVGMLQYYGGIGLYNIHFRDDEQLEEEELFSHWSIFIFSIGSTLLMNLLRQVEHLVEVMAIVGAVAMYWTSCNFIKCLNRYDSFTGNNNYYYSDEIIRTYLSFVEMMSTINFICGCIVLIYMLGMVPTFVWCVFGIFELNSFEYLLYYVHKFIMHSSLLIIAAEANAEASKFTEWIMRFVTGRHRRNDNESIAELDQDRRKDDEFSTFLNFSHREMCTNPVGLKGADFFTISYGFIGTTVSVIVTYAVIMLQFQVEKYQKLNKLNSTMGCNCSE
ncbi:uncharacterized protein LOC110847820 [Folsomia candida]|nr:uncharacterized protein LOC110847820 [Folsomia candida]